MPLVVVLLAYSLLHEDLELLLIFTSFVVVYSILKFDPRIPIGYAILLFIIQAVFTTLNNEASVKLLAVLSFWLLVAGIVGMIIDLFRKKQTIQAVS